MGGMIQILLSGKYGKMKDLWQPLRSRVVVLAVLAKIMQNCSLWFRREHMQHILKWSLTLILKRNC